MQRPAFDWFGLFEFPNGAPTPLNLTGYDLFQFDLWSPNVTEITVRFRDYGANGVWDAGDAGPGTDRERAVNLGQEAGLIAGQWSRLTVDLNQLFIEGDPRAVGQLVILVNGREPAYLNTYLYFANLMFIRQ